MFLFCFALLESSGGKAATPNAFIFSLSNSEGLAPFVSKVKDTEKAIERSPNDGPLFGQDLFIFFDGASRESYTSLGACYSAPASVKNKGSTILDGHVGTFSPDEVEVFFLDPSR